MKVLKLDWLPDHAKSVLYAIRDRLWPENELKSDRWLEAMGLLLSLEDPEDAIGLLARAPKRKERFPLYLMEVEGRESLMPLRPAGATFDSGWMRVDTGDVVLDEGYIARPMTRADKVLVSQTADEYSANK